MKPFLGEASSYGDRHRAVRDDHRRPRVRNGLVAQSRKQMAADGRFTLPRRCAECAHVKALVGDLEAEKSAWFAVDFDDLQASLLSATSL